MSQTRWTSRHIPDAPLQGNPAHQEITEDTSRAVIAAYTAAVTGSKGMRSKAFDAALRAYRRHHPRVSEATGRRRTAQVICFAGAKPDV